MEMHTHFERLALVPEVTEDILTGAYADMDRILRGTLVWPEVSPEAREKYLHHPGPLMPHEMDVPNRESLVEWSKNIQRIHSIYKDVLEPYGGLAHYAQLKGTSNWKALESMIKKEIESVGSVDVPEVSIKEDADEYPYRIAA